MITIDGDLSLKTIHGIHGEFNVGVLSTSIGDFHVKDALLDQFEEGVYQGNFVIKKIYTAWNTWTQGKLLIETRAVLDDLSLNNVETLPSNQFEDLPPDPMDEVEQKPARSTKRRRRPKKPSSPGPETLFGFLWPLSDVVRLDTTVDRAVLRQQRDYLKTKGYAFDPATQQWMLN